MGAEGSEKKSTRVVLNPLRKKVPASYDVLVADNDSHTGSLESSEQVTSENGTNDAYIIDKGGIVLMNVAWFGQMLTTMAMLVVAIPAQVSYLVGHESKTHCLALLATVCSGVVLLLSPVFGSISDNYKSKYGRRRPFMIGGTVVFCIGLVLAGLMAPYFSQEQKLFNTVDNYGNSSVLACNVTKPRCTSDNSSLFTASLRSPNHMQRDFALYTLAVVVVITGNSLTSTAFNGLIADKTHPSARGFSSGILGVMVLSGNVAGAGLGTFSDELLVVGTFAILCVVNVVSVLVTCYFTPEVPTDNVKIDPTPFSVKRMLCGFIRPFKFHDFRWVFITRFLLQMGLASSVGFFEYWLDDVVDLPDCMSPMKAVSLIFIPMMLCGAVSSGVCGVLTDKFQRRKIFVYISCTAMAILSLSTIFIRIYWVAVAVMAVIGIAYGSYVAVEMAMVFDILPSASERAKDLAVWHQSLLLPQLIATPIGGLLVHSFQRISIGSTLGCSTGLGYNVLFGVTAVYFLASGLLTAVIKGIK